MKGLQFLVFNQILSIMTIFGKLIYQGRRENSLEIIRLGGMQLRKFTKIFRDTVLTGDFLMQSVES